MAVGQAAPGREQEIRTLEAIMEGRRSIRQFKDAPVPEEDLLKIIRAAGLAPSAGNQQMWHFLLIRDKALMEEMRQAIFDAVNEMLAWEESQPYELRVRAIRSYATFFVNAPITIAVLNKPFDSVVHSQIYSSQGLSFKEIYRRTGDPGRQSLGAAIQNLLLMAHAMGYGTCWMTGPMVASSALEKILRVEEPWQLAAIIPLGVPAERPGLRPRKKVQEICTFIDG